MPNIYRNNGIINHFHIAKRVLNSNDQNIIFVIKSFLNEPLLLLFVLYSKWKNVLCVCFFNFKLNINLFFIKIIGEDGITNPASIIS